MPTGASQHENLGFMTEQALKSGRAKPTEGYFGEVPFTIRYSAIDTYNGWTRAFTEIKRNAVVEDKLFAMPAASPK